ncbi:PREDICTED: GPN-loop GTPase 3-like isoform X2 [Priapulus caudatus]|uniref:GPN-loop GTPase 3 n=1 Tax=Priapulus caudatus TaxID=37621 RepID=A0ABM1EJE8_PRICU|nr:PREDICTED: GPN-loop GTPase 3-like isoform X2 [Priapulus caudatus]
MRYAQLVIGPAGSGKSTYCSTIQKHGEATRRSIHVVNLDPAAEQFQYNVLADIRELIHLDDVVEDEDLHFGPNGGLVFCMEYFAQNFDWLQEQLGDGDDDYILFDCPGQIELYTHLPVMRQLVDCLQSWDFRVCSVFLLDAQFLVQTSKYFSGVLVALSTMVNLELPHINVLSKVDLLSKSTKQELEKYLDPDVSQLLGVHEDEDTHWHERFYKLSRAIANLMKTPLVMFYMQLTTQYSMGKI